MKEGDALSLPKGWELVTLKDVCYFENGDRGKNYPSKKHYVSEGFPFITAANVENGQVLNNLNYITEDRFKLLSRGKFKKNDFLFCLRGSLGKFGFVQNDLIGGIASSMVIVRTGSTVEDKWLHYYFISDICQKEIENRKGGAAQPNLGAKDLKKFEIPIPPLPEQKQIVAILDKTFSAIDQAQANIEKNIENAKELFQSKLNEIFSQKGDGWEEKSLGKITSKIGSGATPRGGQKSYKKEGISLIRSLNVYDDGFRPEKLAFIDDEQAERLDNVTIEEGDVLLNITGASVARCCIAPADFLPARVNQHVSIIRIENQAILPEFLHLSLISKENKDKLLGIGEQGATRQAITKTQIQKFEVKFPADIKNQKQIVNQLNDLKTETETVEAHYQQKLANLEDLKKSLLQKAFSGQLSEPMIVND